jgi:cytoskeletal protein RodZ
MNTTYSRNEQKPQIFAIIAIALVMVIVLHFSLNVVTIHSFQITTPFANIQTHVLSDTSSPVAVPVPTPPSAQIQTQSTPDAPAPVQSAKVTQPVPMPAPAPSLP